MTKQEIFDKVATHLLKQGRQSVDAEDDCQYRGPDGLMCAVGCLIPDEVYNASIEGMTAARLFRPGSSLRKACGVPVTAIGLLSELQKVHDDCSPGTWRKKLHTVARRFNLSPAVLG